MSTWSDLAATVAHVYKLFTYSQNNLFDNQFSSKMHLSANDI